MDTKDVYDWQAVSKQFGTNYQISTLNARIMWNEVKHFQVKKEPPSCVFSVSYTHLDVYKRQRLF